MTLSTDCRALSPRHFSSSSPSSFPPNSSWVSPCPAGVLPTSPTVTANIPTPSAVGLTIRSCVLVNDLLTKRCLYLYNIRLARSWLSKILYRLVCAAGISNTFYLPFEDHIPASREELWRERPVVRT